MKNLYSQGDGVRVKHVSINSLRDWIAGKRGVDNFFAVLHNVYVEIDGILLRYGICKNIEKLDMVSDETWDVVGRFVFFNIAHVPQKANRRA